METVTQSTQLPVQEVRRPLPHAAHTLLQRCHRNTHVHCALQLPCLPTEAQEEKEGRGSKEGIGFAFCQ